MVKHLLCHHEYEFVRNIYGDEINLLAGCRSVWRCKKCGRLLFSRKLYEDQWKDIQETR